MEPLLIGANEWGEAVAVASPLRSAHVLGVPGMGKSTLIGQLAVAYAREGCGVLVLDIKGGALANEIVTRGRLPLEQLVLFAPGLAFAQGRTWALNPLVGPASVVPDTIIDMLKRAGDLQEQFTQLKEHLEMGLELAVRQPAPPTLHALVKLLTDPVMRESMMTAPHQPERLRTWWADFHRQGLKGGGTSQRQRDAVSSTIVRLDPWLVKEPLATLLDHPANTLQLGAELDAGRLLVCDLVTGVSPRQTLRLGNLLMALLINAALAREPQAESRPWIVIADEFDQLAGEFYRYSLDKLRAAGLSIVAAHQNLSQLPPELANSFASVPIKLYFRPSALDVPLLKRLYPGTSTLWSGLHQHQVAVHLEDAEEDGLYWPVEAHGWEVAETADWPDPPDQARLHALTARMLAPPYTLPRADTRESHDQEPPRAPDPRAPRQDPAAGADRPGTADPAPARPPRLVGQRPDRIPLVSRRPDPGR